MKTINTAIAFALTFATLTVAAPANANPQTMMESAATSTFKGVEANGGTATLYKDGTTYHLKVSDDFKIPASPAPHWQVVDGKGNTYLLSRFTIVGDKTHRDIALPMYIKSVSKVQVYCSFAEVVLGEAKFAKTMNLRY